MKFLAKASDAMVEGIIAQAAREIAAADRRAAEWIMLDRAARVERNLRESYLGEQRGRRR